MAVVTITEAAAQKVKQLMDRDKRDESFGLRLKVVGGGCSGLQYQLIFDNQKQEWDQEFEQNGVKGLVDAKSAGITCLPLKDTIARDKLFRLEFKDVKVPQANVVGAMDQGWATVEKILSHGAVAECARMLGGARRVLEMCVAYAKERKQFNRPIGSYQIIQHY